MKVSVVIVSYKVPYHLILCLDSVKNAILGIDAEIIVVDNASNDQTQILVSTYFPEVKYIQNPTNDGFSKANNIGINQAKGEYICLINPDTIIAETCIASAIDKHKTQKKCGILGVRLIDGTGSFLPESKVNKLTLSVAALKMLGFSKSYYNNLLKETEEGKTATLVGAFMCFKKQDYIKLEGLDERYFMYGEDIDLSHQFMQAGYQNYYLGSENIIHFKGESTTKDEVYFKRFFESIKLFFTKYYTNSKLMIIVLSIFFILAKRFKKSDIDKKTKPKTSFQKIYLIGKDLELSEQLETHFNQNITSLNFEDAQQIDLNNTLIIFNTQELKFLQIINLMLKNNNAQNIFRIAPKHLDILIGSDSSTSQGEVVCLN